MKKSKKPIYVTYQKSYKGRLEKLPSAEFCTYIVCKTCGEKRFVRKQNLGAIKYCKPCQRGRRNKRSRK